jgi:hypothetical protein
MAGETSLSRATVAMHVPQQGRRRAPCFHYSTPALCPCGGEPPPRVPAPVPSHLRIMSRAGLLCMAGKLVKDPRRCRFPETESFQGRQRR